MGGDDKSQFVSDLQSTGLGSKGSPSIDAGGNANGKTLPERKVISTATLTIEVVSVQVAINDITNITLESGGFISSSSIRDIGSNRKNGGITARVPQKNFYSTIEKIDALGTEKQRQVSGQDVTEEFIDLGAGSRISKNRKHGFRRSLKWQLPLKILLKLSMNLNECGAR